MTLILLVLSLFVAFFIESVFGFGGTILALAAISNFIEVKTAILIAAYAAICSSSFILLSGRKHFSLQHLINIYIYALPGTVIGTLVFLWLSPVLLLKIFAVFLISYSLYSLFNPHFQMPKVISSAVLFLAGIIQGIFGTGGPFMLMAYGHEFKNKFELRTMVAAFLLFGNIVRVIQLSLMGKLDTGIFFSYWWVAAPIALAIGLGYFFHVKIKEDLFKKGVLCLMLMAGLAFLFK